MQIIILQNATALGSTSWTAVPACSSKNPTKFGITNPPLHLMDYNSAQSMIVLISKIAPSCYGIPTFLDGIKGAVVPVVKMIPLMRKFGRVCRLVDAPKFSASPVRLGRGAFLNGPSGGGCIWRREWAPPTMLGTSTMGVGRTWRGGLFKRVCEVVRDDPKLRHEGDWIPSIMKDLPQSIYCWLNGPSAFAPVCRFRLDGLICVSGSSGRRTRSADNLAWRKEWTTLGWGGANDRRPKSPCTWQLQNPPYMTFSLDGWTRTNYRNNWFHIFFFKYSLHSLNK
jgi:hypothetical protein